MREDGPDRKSQQDSKEGTHMTVSAQDVRAAAPANAPEDVIDFVVRLAELGKPEKVHFCDGSDAEWDRLTTEMVESGMFTRLNPNKPH